MDLIWILIVQTVALFSHRFSTVYFRGTSGGSLAAQAAEKNNIEQIANFNQGFLLVYMLFNNIGAFLLLLVVYSLPIFVAIKYGWIFFLLAAICWVGACIISPFFVLLFKNDLLVYKIAQWKFPLDIILGVITLFFYLDHFQN